MTDTNKVVVCLIKNEKSEYLLIKPSNYKDFGKYQDAWYPPTGHVKKNETMEQALKRELKEELNLTIKPTKLISKWEQDIPGEVAYWWESEVVKGKIKKSDEIKEYGWFSPEEIKKLKLWPAEEKFFRKFLWK